MDLADRIRIEDTIKEFFWLIDSGKADAGYSLLAADAVLEYGPGSPVPGVLSGDALRKQLEQRAAQTHVTSRHIVGNFRFQPIAEGKVHVRWVMTVYRSETASRDSYPVFVADVDETMVDVDGGWRTSRRKMTPVFAKAPIP